MSVLSLCLTAVIEGEVFVSSGSLLQARVTEGSRTKHPGTKHPMPFFYTLDKTPHKDLPPRTKHPTLFLSPRT